MRIRSQLFGAEIVETELSALSRQISARFPFGKYLVLTDEESAPMLVNALKNLPKKIVLVLKEGEDLRSLFLVSDGITCVVGAGKAADAARYFASVRSLPFAAVCLSCAPAGLLRRRAHVKISGTNVVYPVLKSSLIFADEGSMSANKAGMAEARCFLAACRLSLFSFDAVFELFGSTGETPKAAELRPLFSAAVLPVFSDDVSAGFLFDSVLTAEYCFEEGFPEGEIFSFCRAAKKIHGGSLQAESSRDEAALPCVCALYLSELYGLFFGSGFYRGGGVDYNARYERAKAIAEGTDISVNAIRVPSAEELKKREAAFEGCKEKYFLEITEIINRLKALLPDFEERKTENMAEILRILPEISSDFEGIGTLMRDFSLL